MLVIRLSIGKGEGECGSWLGVHVRPCFGAHDAGLVQSCRKGSVAMMKAELPHVWVRLPYDGTDKRIPQLWGRRACKTVFALCMDNESE
jgi:hypothetical protein